MRIAIDARELQGRPTGVGRYLSGLLEAWRTLPSAAPHDFVLLAPRDGGGTLWEQFTLPRLVRKADAGVFFAPGYTGPALCPVPMVVAIHDVSFAAHPEWFSWREGIRRRTLTRLAAKRAARILTISEFSRGEIATRLGVSESKIDVIYPAPATAVDARLDAGGRDPLVLYVGSLFTRRHIPELIGGFAQVAADTPDVRLEIVGDNRTTPPIDFARTVAASGSVDRIVLRSYVPENELASLYSRARAFVFLSEYEGFGLTPLEALAAGIPIVVLDTPVAREVYGDAALYVSEPDPARIAAAVRRALFDEPERARILAAARRMLPRYSWEGCAEQVLRVLLQSSR